MYIDLKVSNTNHLVMKRIFSIGWVDLDEINEELGISQSLEKYKKIVASMLDSLKEKCAINV